MPRRSRCGLNAGPRLKFTIIPYKIIENHHGRAWVRMGGALSRPAEIALAPPSESARCTPRRTTPSAKDKPQTEVRPQSPDEREHCKAVALLAIAPFVTIPTTSAPLLRLPRLLIQQRLLVQSQPIELTGFCPPYKDASFLYPSVDNITV